MIHQVECHSSISQDSNCCRRQMKDSVLYKVQVVWMNDDFFWASQCLKHLSKIYQLSLAELSEWVLFSLCEWYSYFHWWITASTLKSCMKDTTTALRSRPTNWHWQMWVWSQVNQVSRVHSESEKEHTNEFSKDEGNHELTSPKSVKSVQSFIDFANFYWKFIKNFLIWLCQWWLSYKRTHF
jgi:hypothetical protein